MKPVFMKGLFALLFLIPMMAKAQSTEALTYTLENLNSQEGMTVLSGDESILKNKIKVYVDDIDFSACIVEEKPLLEWLASLGEKYLEDWPADQEKIQGQYYKDRINRGKNFTCVSQKEEADYIIKTSILKITPGYYTPVGIASVRRKASAHLWGVVEFQSNGQTVLALSVNNLCGEYTFFTPTMRIEYAFWMLSDEITKKRK